MTFGTHLLALPPAGGYITYINAVDICIAVIRIGAAGIPLSCKDRTNRDGVIYTRNLGLSAMEIQLSRGFISREEATDIRETADKCGIDLYIHAPYYINLTGNERNVEMSQNKIWRSMRLAELMDARMVTTHTGFYGSLSKHEAMQRMAGRLRMLRDQIKMEGIEIPIGVQTIGKPEVFGTLEEIVELCTRVRGIHPVLDMAHIHARQNGRLQEKEDFQEVFNSLAPLNLDHVVVYLTGVRYNAEGEIYHVPVRKSDMPVIKLMECIVEHDYNVTIISESPILEHDAVYGQILVDRAMEIS